MVAAEVHVEPADDDGHGAVGAHGDEEEREVFDVRLGVDVEEDGEAGDGEGDGDEGEEEAVFGFVGEVGDYHGEGEGACPGGHAVELGPDLGVAVCSDDAGCEVGITWGRCSVSDDVYLLLSPVLDMERRSMEYSPIGGDDQSHVHETSNKDFEILEDVHDIFRSDGPFDCAAALVFL